MSAKLKKEDVLKELFNIGVGQAASTLSEIIDKKIVLRVPDVKVLDLQDGKKELDLFLQQVAAGAVMVSSISFDQQLEGKISLIFPAEKMHRFIDLCLHEEHDVDETIDFTDIDFDTIKEIGNILMNAIMGELSNNIHIPVEYTLPEVGILSDARADAFVNEEMSYLVVLMYISFNIEGTEIEGGIVINMTLKSLDDVMNTIEKWL
ncbi:MAG: chemotaxis protein CheC [Sporolactobacillus sp.]